MKGIRTHNFGGNNTDSYKSNYYTITTMMAHQLEEQY
jgi:hypothetical protein